MKTHHTQCFYAKQKKHLNIETSKLETDAEGVKIDRIVSKNPKAVLTAVTDKPKLAQEESTDGDLVVSAAEEVINAQTAPADETNLQLEAKLDAKIFQKAKSHKRYNAHARHVPSDETDLLISSINSLDIGWKADTCKLQKHHAEYGSHCDSVNLAQTSEATDNEAEEKLFENHQAFAGAWEEAKKF